jgi:protein SCO1/2
MSNTPQPPERQTPRAGSPMNAMPFAVLGALMIGVIVIGLVMGAGLQQLATSAPTPTFAPDVPGVTPIEPPSPIADFTMPATTGENVSLSDFRGKHVLIFFGYTHCPDFCPLTLAEFRRVKTMLGDDAERVEFVFISVDGARDTVEQLNRYVTRFDPSFIGMQGDEATLARLTPDFGLFYQINEPDENGNYLVDHSTPSYLVDPQGRLVTIFSFSAETEVIVEVLQARLS